VAVWRLQTAGDGRSEERERVAGERRERLWDLTESGQVSWNN
jgi:hypothetical protein